MAYCIFGSGGDANITRIVKTETKMDGSFYIMSNYEFKIRKLYCYKDLLDGFSFLLTEIEPMQTNDKLGQVFSGINTVEGGYDKGYYISREEYDDGYSEYGKISDKCELRVRFVGPELFIISPKLCSMYNAQQNGIIRQLYNNYQNNNFILNQDFIKSLMPPNVKRNIYTPNLCIEF